jgi:hypothetical protein
MKIRLNNLYLKKNKKIMSKKKKKGKTSLKGTELLPFLKEGI